MILGQPPLVAPRLISHLRTAAQAEPSCICLASLASILLQLIHPEPSGVLRSVGELGWDIEFEKTRASMLNLPANAPESR